MHRTTSLAIAALMIAACAQSTEPTQASSASASKDTPAATPKAEQPVEAPEQDPWQKKLAARVLADSGLAVGGKLSAFDIINCETGDEYCQVCKFGGSPKIMAIGSPDDADFRKDLAAIQALVDKYGNDKVKAFAVVTTIADGKATTPGADAVDAKAKAKAIRDELKLAMPVVIPAADKGGNNRVWDEYYNVTKSRTVMFADGRNVIKYSAVGPADFAELDKSIEQVVGAS